MLSTYKIIQSKKSVMIFTIVFIFCFCLPIFSFPNFPNKELTMQRIANAIDGYDGRIDELRISSYTDSSVCIYGEISSFIKRNLVINFNLLNEVFESDMELHFVENPSGCPVKSVIFIFLKNPTYSRKNFDKDMQDIQSITGFPFSSLIQWEPFNGSGFATTTTDMSSKEVIRFISIDLIDGFTTPERSRKFQKYVLQQEIFHSFTRSRDANANKGQKSYSISQEIPNRPKMLDIKNGIMEEYVDEYFSLIPDSFCKFDIFMFVVANEISNFNLNRETLLLHIEKNINNLEIKAESIWNSPKFSDLITDC